MSLLLRILCDVRIFRFVICEFKINIFLFLLDDCVLFHVVINLTYQQKEKKETNVTLDIDGCETL